MQPALQNHASNAPDHPNIEKEFAEFAYVVSHDLGTPLRHIREFSRLLLQKLANRIGDDEREYVQFIERSIHKTEDMIEGLLQYSRLNTRTLPFTHVDCNEALENAKKSLAENIKNRKAKITVNGILPFVTGDPGQITSLFVHLVDNATKFHMPGGRPEVTISVEKKANRWQFAINDNGIGIEEKYYSNVFTIFRRLHDEAAYPGIGLGLALAKKIVEHRHGGLIWIESEPGKGTTVFFTLPPEGSSTV